MAERAGNSLVPAVRPEKGVCRMSGNLVITIGRQCGSGGKLIGEKLAEKMGVKCYDKELLSKAAKHSGLCQELFEKHDERPTSSLFIFFGDGFLFYGLYSRRILGYAY